LINFAKILYAKSIAGFSDSNLIMDKKINKYKKSIILLFLVISIFVLAKIIFNDQLIGRSLDCTVAPVSFLAENEYLRNFYTWRGIINGGARNTFPVTLIPVDTILDFPLIFKVSSWFIARYQIVVTLFFGMLFFYILAKRILEGLDLREKYKIPVSIIAAIFFTLNSYFFCELIFGSNVIYLTFAFIPLFVYSIISYQKTKKYYYFFLALLSLTIVSSALQHMVFAYMIFIIVTVFIYKDYKFFIKIGLAHLLISLYWILPMLFTTAEIKNLELTNNPIHALTISSQSFLNSILNKDYVFNRDHYMLALSNNYLTYVWIFNAVILLALSLYSIVKIKHFEKEQKKYILWFAIIFLVSIVFIKGGREPLGSFVILLYEKIPVFNLFRSIQHYISFYVLSISILFIFSSAYLVKKKPISVYFLGLFVIINALPWWWTLDLGTKNIIQSNKIPSYFGQYYLTEGNWKMYNLNNLKIDFSMLPIPPGLSINFLALGKNDSNYIDRKGIKIKTQGGDMGLGLGNKGFYTAEMARSSFGEILNNLEKEMYSNKDFFDDYKNVFSLLNIKYFILREDTRPLFSKNSPAFNLAVIKEAISNSKIFKSSTNTDYITILENKEFLPSLYTPKSNIVTPYSSNNLDVVVSGDDYQIRSAIFFKKQNEGKDEVLNNLNGKVDGDQILEFKKINPTKYRVMIHGASGQFPLVFSESFHDGWKAYLTPGVKIPPSPPFTKGEGLLNYKILDGNEEDQASKDELADYISKGWITSLGDNKEKEIKHQKWEDNKEKLDYIEKYNIDFVSKNFQGTIQNDNLPKGNFWETWLASQEGSRLPRFARNDSVVQIPEENHLMANGYANSWVVDTDKICAPTSPQSSPQTGEEASLCVKNADGTYDLELVVEFWPQRLFYIGLGISGLTLLSCLGYLGYDLIRRRRKQKIGDPSSETKQLP